MEDKLLLELNAFIQDYRWEYPFPINKDTRIEKDLGITGDEAVGFLLAFSEKFNVDISNFKATEYFHPEGDRILPAIINLLLGRRKEKSKELIISDLIIGIIAGKLDETVLINKHLK